MISPDSQSPHVISFCKGISDSSPVIIPLRPVTDVPLNECFGIVEQHISANGGRGIIGWSIWEWPGIFIEAEFHMVWEAPDKSLIDLTPKPKAFDTVTFLPDPKKQYRGRQIDNIRKPLIKSLTVRRFLDTAKKFHAEMNKGDLANYHGEVKATPKMIKLQNEMARLHMQLISKFGEP